MIEIIFESVVGLLRPQIILIISLGILVGIIFGATPGLGSVLGMTIFLPITIIFDGTTALIFLVSIYSGAMYGSAIASILINVPGTPSAAATTFDGYPLAQQGRAIESLTTSVTASVFGGTLAMIALLLMIPILRPIVLAFGAPQIFLVALFGIVLIGIISSAGSTFKGIVSGMFGVLIMTIGLAPGIADARYTFGLIELFDGITFLAVLIGMFAIGEMLRLSDENQGTIQEEGINSEKSIINDSLIGAKNTIFEFYLTVKSAGIGMIIGMIPGMGGAAANFFSYTEAVRSSDKPDSFGEGNPDGVVAAEASNNATVAGSLVPLLSFGIPGSASTAVLLGGFIMHGIDPGPAMFTDDILITYSLVIALIFGNIVIFVLGFFVVTRIGDRIVRTHIDIIIPIVIVLAAIGTYGVRANWFDVLAMFIFGMIAYYMVKYNYSIIALVIGAVLSDILETNFQRSLRLSEGSYMIFFDDLLSLIIIAALILFMFGTFVVPKLKSSSSE